MLRTKTNANQARRNSQQGGEGRHQSHEPRRMRDRLFPENAAQKMLVEKYLYPLRHSRRKFPALLNLLKIVQSVQSVDFDG